MTTNFPHSSHTASSVFRGNELERTIPLHGKSYRLKIYYKESNQEKEITDNYSKIDKNDFQRFLQSQIKEQREAIHIEISPTACTIQDYQGAAKKEVPGFTGFQSIKFLQTFLNNKINRIRDRNLNSNTHLNSSFIRISLEAITRKRKPTTSVKSSQKPFKRPIPCDN